MQRETLISKLHQQKTVIKNLEKKGVCLNEMQDVEMKELMSACESEIMKSFPDPNSFQLF
ncbi:hypothetical protein KUTeg_009375 [Tegillarca granosa]|uniref:Uncharacterized protein n=1 Tax=Tegillarca granosa TaxID=220873 RepID=A0ABQ9F6U9_TEGGR|nr:hypothetical protein KUTeg_009375 [Tegillarca granosa]